MTKTYQSALFTGVKHLPNSSRFLISKASSLILLLFCWMYLTASRVLMILYPLHSKKTHTFSPSPPYSAMPATSLFLKVGFLQVRCAGSAWLGAGRGFCEERPGLPCVGTAGSSCFQPVPGSSRWFQMLPSGSSQFQPYHRALLSPSATLVAPQRS